MNGEYQRCQYDKIRNILPNLVQFLKSPSGSALTEFEDRNSSDFRARAVLNNQDGHTHIAFLDTTKECDSLAVTHNLSEDVDDTWAKVISMCILHYEQNIPFQRCFREEQISQNTALIVTVSHEGAQLISRPWGKCYVCFSVAGGEKLSQSNRRDKGSDWDRDDWKRTGPRQISSWDSLLLMKHKSSWEMGHFLKNGLGVRHSGVTKPRAARCTALHQHTQEERLQLNWQWTETWNEKKH